MSTTSPASALDPPNALNEQPRIALAKPRVLACLLCQQRKVKCDRKFPCANCVRTGAQCVPAGSLPPRQRRRRFPERELLDRLRQYEDLLRQHNINFEPLHPPVQTGEHASPEDAKSSAHSKETVNLWHAISRVTLDSDSDENHGKSEGEEHHNADPAMVYFNNRLLVPHRRTAFKEAWNQRFQEGTDSNYQSTGRANDHLLFGSPRTNVDLSTSHPDKALIFRLWQIYLDNVNPLLKVTHTPSLQPRIIDAASDVTNIGPSLEALIFGIYCVSVLSLTEDECQTLFQIPKRDLSEDYQFCCQQALLKCSVWQSGDSDALAALYLYLVSFRLQTDPRSLSCMLAVAIRTAQQLGMHQESAYNRCNVLEAEMRRRLWWSLVIFDHRLSELSDYKTTTLAPTWNCSLPLNVNDFELRADMKASPAIHQMPTEALFAVVRAELADFIRHSPFHLNFVNPSLNDLVQRKAKDRSADPEKEGLTSLETRLEEKYFAHCDAGDPLHYMTMWTTRGTIARNRLLEHYSRHSTSSMRPTDQERIAARSFAIRMLECDTKLRISSLTKGYLWFTDFHFPALAYLHILNGLTKRPDEEGTEEAWETMSANYDAFAMRLKPREGDEQPGSRFLVTFSQVFMQAWEAREVLLRQQGKPPEPPPRIVSDVANKMMHTSAAFTEGYSNVQQPDDGVIDSHGTLNSLSFQSMNFNGQSGNTEGSELMNSTRDDQFANLAEQPILDVDMDQLWAQIDWRWMHTQGW